MGRGLCTRLWGSEAAQMVTSWLEVGPGPLPSPGWPRGRGSPGPVAGGNRSLQTPEPCLRLRLSL